MALSDEALYGLHIFRTDGGCMNCHHGSNFTDNRFHGSGLTFYGRQYEDLGRYYVTKKKEDVGRFRTPTLRNVERTGPYMHRGAFSLTVSLNLIKMGMPDVKPKPHEIDAPLFLKKSHLFRPVTLRLGDEAYLEAFLKSLTEPACPDPVPKTTAIR